MSMATMNPAAGGPVGGMMMMNSGSPAVNAGMNNNADPLKSSLNTYVYDYLLKNGHYEIARSILRDDKFEFRREQKTSPGRRKDGEMNGDGGDIDLDMKDEVPDELPRPWQWDGSQGNGFLFEWFSIFSDLFAAHRMSGSGKLNGNNMNPAAQYLIHEKNNQRLREIQNQSVNRPGMNPAMIQRMNGAMTGAMNGNIQGKMTQQQMQAIQQKRAMAMQQQMNRGDQADGEMNGVRPSTPAGGDDGGSPSKRPRIDNGQPGFNNGMMQNGRPGVPGAPNQGMLMQAGFNPALNPQFQRNGAMPQPGMKGMPNGGMMNMGGAGSPMMQNMNQFPEGMQIDYMNQRPMGGGQPGMQQGGGAQSGNHALQDYQMQLMLLEQQNKKRLMMARQEQHENNPGAGGAMPGVNMPAGMSPSGSRTGTSPNPGEMKRTPGMPGVPGSPSAGDVMGAGRSPAAMNFMGNMQGQDFNPGMFMGDKGQMMNAGGPQGMRPPTSNEMGAMRQQGGRPGQFQGGQPMQQQGSQAGQQLGTPGQREMPPPQAPAGGNGRNQGASPSNGNAPPTPSQTNKANPKNKKGAAKDDNKRQRPNKKGSAANAPASDDNPPATPTPSTPITPNNPGAMNAGNKGQPGMQPGNQVQQNQAMQMNPQMQQNDLGFGSFADSGTGAGAEQFNLDFSTLENADVLENFDFDSFLNTSADDTFNVDIGADFGGDFMGQDQ